jgi:predicted metalloprotease with PDZ domain
MRALNENFAKKGKGFPEAELQRTVEQAGGGSWDAFFADFVEGVRDLPFEEYLAKAGLLLGPKATPEDEEEREKLDTVFLGIVPVEREGRIYAESVLAGSPAFHAGINAGDEILALDGIRVTSATFAERLRDYRPGDAVQLAAFRSDRWRQFKVTLAPPAAELALTPHPQAGAAERRIFSGWLGADLGAH